jgi:hypothetical protein
VATQNACLPHEEEKHHVANPTQEIPAKSAPYHPGDDGNGGRQETSQEVQQVTPVEMAVQRIANGTISALGDILPGADAEWVSGLIVFCEGHLSPYLKVHFSFGAGVIVSEAEQSPPLSWGLLRRKLRASQ